MGLCRPSLPCRTATASSISTSSCATFRRRSSGSIAGRTDGMFGVYVTHPQVQIDPDVPVPQWGLSTVGRERAVITARLPWVRSLGRIVSSDETKAIDTAQLLADAA